MKNENLNSTQQSKKKKIRDVKLNILYYFFKVGIIFLYVPLKFRKTKKNKIVFVSRQANEKTLDFKLIQEELIKQTTGLEYIFICKRIESNGYSIFKHIKFIFLCMLHLSNAKVCVTDSYNVAISVLKHKKKLKILQIWHSMGAIKKFGHQNIDSEMGRNSKIVKIFNMHRNYDCLISGSALMTKFFKEAFLYDESYFFNYGLPRIDYLIKNKLFIREKIFKEYSNLKNKKIILYAPTYRKKEKLDLEKLVKNIDLEEYYLIIKSHFGNKKEYNTKDYEYTQFSAMEFLCVADVLITDYSGIAIEAAAIDVKTLYYVYDYNEYIKENGLNIDLYKEMPDCVFEKSEDVMRFIKKNYNYESLFDYKNKYIDVKDGTSTFKIAKLILKLMGENK